MHITLTVDQLSNLLIESAEIAADRVCMNAKIKSKTITLAEVKKLHGRKLAQQARMSESIKWKPIGKGGRTSGVECDYKEFEKFHLKIKLSFYHEK